MRRAGPGQIVRGVHMRLHAGSHVDAPEHFVKGGKQIISFRSRPSSAPRWSPTSATACRAAASRPPTWRRPRAPTSRTARRILLRTDCNKDYDGSAEWQKRSPYLTNDAIDWCLKKRVLIVGFDMYHGADAPDLAGDLQHPRAASRSRAW